MTGVSKEYEIKRKMVQEQWTQLKMTFLLGYNLKVLFSGEGGEGGELTFGGEGIKIGGAIFPGGKEWANW